MSGDLQMKEWTAYLFLIHFVQKWDHLSEGHQLPFTFHLSYIKLISGNHENITLKLWKTPSGLYCSTFINIITNLIFSTAPTVVCDASIKHWQPSGSRESSTPGGSATAVRRGGLVLGRGSGQTTSSSVLSPASPVTWSCWASSPPSSPILQRLVLGSKTAATAAAWGTRTGHSCSS